MSNKFQNEDFKSESDLTGAGGTKAQLLNTTKVYSPKSDETLENVLKKNNDVAIIAPVITNDSSQGYEVGSRWIDTVGGNVYYCVDNSVGAAVWKLAGLGAGGVNDILTDKGDVLTSDGSNLTKVAAAEDGSFLTTDSTETGGLKWQKPISGKGDLLTHDGVNYLGLPAGAEGDVLTVDPSTESGLAWKQEEAAINFDASLINGLVLPQFKWDNLEAESGEDNPDIPVAGNSSHSRWSRDNNFCAITYTTSPFINIYARVDNNLIKLDDITDLPAGAANGCAWNYDASLLAIAHDTTPFITVYKRDGNNFTKLVFGGTLPTGNANKCAFSHDGNFLAVAHAVSPFVSIYEVVNGVTPTFTKVTNPATLPTGIARGANFSPNGQFLAVTHEVTPWVTIYERVGSVFTKLANPATIPTGIARGISFNPAGNLMAVAHATTPFITVYSIAGTTFTKLTNPATLPASTGNGVDFGYPVNIAAYSEQFDNAAWIKTNTTIVTNDLAAPDGATTAEKLVEDASTATHTVSQSMPVLNGAYYTYSVYLKAAGRDFPRLTMSSAFFGGSTPQAIFDLVNGEVYAFSNCIANVEDIGSGWWRCSITALCTASGLSSQTVQLTEDGSSLSYTGDNASGVYIWGAQFETGNELSSYTSATDATYYMAVAHATTPFVTIYSVTSANVITKLVNPPNLPTGIGNGANFSVDGGLLMISHDVFPFITMYEKTDNIFVKLANPATLPTGISYDTGYSPNGDWLVMGHATSPYITIYQRSGSTYTKLANPASLPVSTVVGVAWNNDSTLLTLAHGASPYITTYQRSGTTFTKLANPAVLPTGTGRRVQYSPDGSFCAIAHDTTPFITIYSVSGTTFTKTANPNILPAAVSGSWVGGEDLSWHPNGTLLAVAHGSYPFMTIYKRTGSTFVKLPNPAVVPSAYCRAIEYSPDGQYLFAGQNIAPWMKIWKVDGDMLDNVAGPNINPTGLPYSISFSDDSKYAIVGHNVTPWFTMYRRNGGDSWKKITPPSTLPTGIGYGVDWLPGSSNVFAISSATTPFVLIYERSGFGFSLVSSTKTTPLVKLTNPSSLPTANAVGCAWSPNGKYLAVTSGTNGTNGFIQVYEKSGETLTRTYVGGNATSNDCEWSADSKYLFYGRTASTYLYCLIVDADGVVTASAAVPATPPTGSVNGISISPNSLYVVATHATTPFVSIYKRSKDILTKVANPTILPTSTGRKSCWSPDGKYLVVTHDTAPFVTVYEVIGDGIFEKIPDLDGLPAVNAVGTNWSPDGLLLIIGHNAAPFMSIYKVTNSIFEKQANPRILPNGVPNDMAWSPTNRYFGVASSLAPYITIYERNLETDVFTKLANPTTLPTGSGNGISFSTDGRMVSVSHTTTPFMTVYRTSQARTLPRGVAKFIFEILAD